VVQCQDAVALRKIISARKNELEQAAKSSSGNQAATPQPGRVQRVRTRCSVTPGVSAASLIAGHLMCDMI